MCRISHMEVGYWPKSVSEWLTRNLSTLQSSIPYIPCLKHWVNKRQSYKQFMLLLQRSWLEYVRRPIINCCSTKEKKNQNVLVTSKDNLYILTKSLSHGKDTQMIENNGMCHINWAKSNILIILMHAILYGIWCIDHFFF